MAKYTVLKTIGKFALTCLVYGLAAGVTARLWR